MEYNILIILCNNGYDIVMYDIQTDDNKIINELQFLYENLKENDDSTWSNNRKRLWSLLEKFAIKLNTVIYNPILYNIIYIMD